MLQELELLNNNRIGLHYTYKHVELITKFPPSIRDNSLHIINLH